MLYASTPFTIPFVLEPEWVYMHLFQQIPGIGRVSERVLTEMGIATCGDVYKHRGMITSMDKQLGLRGLLGAYLGLGSNVVEPPSREGRKSIGAERYAELLHVYTLWVATSTKTRAHHVSWE